MLPPGHKLGEPSPLFAKIDISKIEELKKTFGDTQNNRQNQQSNIDSGVIKSLAETAAKQVCKKQFFFSNYVILL